MKNGEILYLYDAKMCNPNGDPDEENRPRMDDVREINLVSDLRMKRYIRDYLLLQGETLYVQKVDDAPVTSENRVKAFLKNDKLDFQEILDAFIDIRLFGATVTAKKDNKAFTGPVQFNWGYSLNKAEVMESSITSHFSSKEGNAQGSIGKDYRIRYGLIAFSGVISGNRAQKTHLSEEDIHKLDEAMVHAIPLLATRSKIGQYPRLYLRLVFKDDQTMLHDLRSYIKIESDEEALRDITEYKVDVTALMAYLTKNAALIQSIYYYEDEALSLVNKGEDCTIGECLQGFDTIVLE